MSETSEQPVNLPALVLHAARDIERVGTAFDAELLVSTLLGSVYSVALPDRGGAADSFVHALDQHIATADDAVAPTVGAVLAALDGRQVPTVANGPAWVPSLGRVRRTGTYAYGDRYGDQTSYVATFAYDDIESGGPEHAIVVLVDHNLGLAKDIFVAAPAEHILGTLRDDVAADPAAMSWFTEIAPSTVRAAASAYLRSTDIAAELPASESFAADRALTLSRIALLPEASHDGDDAAPSPDGTDPASVRSGLIEAFLSSPEANLAGLTELDGGDRESLMYCLALVVDFATARGDAMRWSPAGVETFLTSWVHERAILDQQDVDLLPGALRAWIAWSGRQIDLPPAALAETLTTAREIEPEFARLYATGERQSPAARAMTAMVAEGVDLTDTGSVQEWLTRYTDADR